MKRVIRSLHDQNEHDFGCIFFPMRLMLRKSGTYPQSLRKLLGGQGTQAKDKSATKYASTDHNALPVPFLPFQFHSTQDARKERTRLGSSMVSGLTAAN
jgi:hypothetical protein